jgi:hypothetical protein
VPVPSTLTERAKAIKATAEKATADPARAETAKGLAMLYREIGKAAPGAKDEATLLDATSRATNMLLASRDPKAMTAWQPTREALGTEWTKLKVKSAPVADYGTLLSEVADGLDASAPQRAIDPALLAFLLEILKIILPLLIR